VNRSVNDSLCWGVPCSLGEWKGMEGKGRGREKYSCGDSSVNRHLGDATSQTLDAWEAKH